MQVVVGRIGRAHGVRGHVAIDVRTDEPEVRFTPGAVLQTDPVTAGPLTVASVRDHSRRTLIHFAQVDNRTDAERLRGVLLLASVDPAERPGGQGQQDDDEYYDRQLVGLDVVDATRGAIGQVAEVVHLPGQELLAVDRPGSRAQVLVPFVAAIVTQVDLSNRRILVELPPGLLELTDE